VYKRQVVATDRPVSDGEGGLMDEAGSVGIGQMLDAVAPGSSMLLEMLKMAMEADAGSGTAQKPQRLQQKSVVTEAYQADEDDEQEER